ncbi:ATP-binding protein [Pontiellaceae bacterium B12227]|nr:ATP-binding protein [Pontiellaceae bacterium B12227]
MFRSFRLKIALSSMLFTVLLLVSFSIFLLRMVYRVGLERTDNELNSVARREIGRTRNRLHMEQLSSKFDEINIESPEKGFVCRVMDIEGEIVSMSGNWPTGYDGSGILNESLVTLVERVPPSGGQPGSPPGSERGFRHPPPVSESVFETLGNVRMVAVCNPEIRMLLGISLGPLNDEVSRLKRNLLLSTPLVLLLMAGGGWMLAGLALRPVKAIAKTARKVTTRSLEERISCARADHEFRDLIKTINDMLARLERGFGQASRFSADAAHELKTPLAILQVELDRGLQQSSDSSEDQRIYTEALEELQRLDGIVHNLLLFSLADAGRMPLNLEPIDWSCQVAMVAEDIGALDPAQRVEVEIQPDIRILGDHGMLAHALQNLVGNAVKYSEGEPPIKIALSEEGARVILSVSNRGVPIPEKDRHKVFERFYRVDRTGGRNIAGTGLGLSLAREIAIAHAGTLELVVSDEKETLFRLSLPSRLPHRNRY